MMMMVTTMMMIKMISGGWESEKKRVACKGICVLIPTLHSHFDHHRQDNDYDFNGNDDHDSICHHTYM